MRIFAIIKPITHASTSRPATTYNIERKQRLLTQGAFLLCVNHLQETPVYLTLLNKNLVTI